MIAMTLAQVAAAIGVAVAGRRGDGRRCGRWSSTPGGSRPARCSSRCAASGSTGTTSPRRPREAGAVAVLGSGADRRRPAAAAGRRPARTTPACSTALAALARASVTALVRDHGLEVIGVTGSSGKTSTKDLIAAVLRSAVDGAGAGGRPAGVVQQRTRPPVHGAARRRAHPVPGAGAVGPRHRAHRRSWPRSRRRGSARCSTSARRTSASSARCEAIATAKSELVQALPSARRTAAWPS